MIVRKWRTRRHTETVGGDVIRTLKQLQENAKQLKLDRKEIMWSFCDAEMLENEKKRNNIHLFQCSYAKSKLSIRTHQTRKTSIIKITCSTLSLFSFL